MKFIKFENQHENPFSETKEFYDLGRLESLEAGDLAKLVTAFNDYFVVEIPDIRLIFSVKTMRDNGAVCCDIAVRSSEIQEHDIKMIMAFLSGYTTGCV